MAAAQPVHTIALSGPSGSGKSTLARELQSALTVQGCAVRVIGQDTFFSTPKPATYWGCENKETPAAVDMLRLRNAITEVRAELAAAKPARPALLIVEGFLLLQDEQIMADVDGVLFTFAPKEVCLARRWPIPVCACAPLPAVGAVQRTRAHALIVRSCEANANACPRLP